MANNIETSDMIKRIRQHCNSCQPVIAKIERVDHNSNLREDEINGRIRFQLMELCANVNCLIEMI